MNIYEVFSKDIVENRRMIYALVTLLLKKGLITSKEAEEITSKGEKEDGLKDQGKE